jgi:hypothetical protein
VRAVLVAVAVAVAGAALGGCAHDVAQFSAQYAPAYKGRTSLSVFGVYRNGTMSPKFWEELRKPLSAAFGAESCEIVFSDRLSSEEPELFERLDKATKNEGVNVELLNEVAPRAQADHVLVVNVFGEVAAPRREKSFSGAPAPPRQVTGAGGRRGRLAPGRAQATDPVEDSAFEISVTLLSAATHEVVATVTMRYTGGDTDEAIARFTTGLRTAIPGSSCVGWKWKEP